MRCHYEVLGISRDANGDEIKKAYRKLALQWHPDKNADNIEEANKRFLEIQDAYETLSDDQERAWYDSHREVLLNGGMDGGAAGSNVNYVFNVYPYFTSSCFKGYGDDEKGFYTVYREVFNKIAEEDKDSYEEDIDIPSFGFSNSDYDTVVANFYAFWQSYCTPRSFVWAEEHDTREANERQVRRLMEKENKKLRDKAKKERNEEIRNLVAFMRKKDKRVEEHKKVLEEKAKQAQKKSEEKREADRKKRLEQMQNYVEPEWIRTTEEQLNQLNLNGEEDIDSSENEDDDEEDFFCVACNKSFKSDKAFMNHEKSKKHKENVELLKKTMKEEDINLFFNNEKNGSEMENDDEFIEGKSKNRLSKKQKKKNKMKNKDEKTDESESENNMVVLDEEDKKTNLETIESKSVENEANSGEKENVEMDESSAATASNKPLICSVCKTEFDSRNKLFEHIKLEGHAAIKNIPQQSKSKAKKSKGKK